MDYKDPRSLQANMDDRLTITSHMHLTLHRIRMATMTVMLIPIIQLLTHPSDGKKLSRQDV